MDVNKEEIGLRQFCHHMLNCPHIRDIMWAGSTFELPLLLAFENVTDLDILICRKKGRIVAKNHVSAESAVNHGYPSNKRYWITATEYWPREPLLRLESKKSHIGFTQLFYDDEMNKDTIAIIHDHRNNGNCGVCNTYTWFGQSEQIWQMYENFIKSDIDLSHLKDFTVDLVDGLHCPMWPEAANEWKTRKRHHCWPSIEVIDSIVANGCHLVAKSHDNQMENISEWRFSFSAAELTLIQSWNYEKKFIYHILRLIKNDVIRKCEEIKPSQLKTYHIKTLMLWTCEKEPPQFWKKENLESSLEMLLCTLIEWMIEKNCPNYFIQSNNMWDNIPSDYDFDMEVQSILSSTEDIKFYVKKTEHLQRGNLEMNSALKVAIPNKLLIVLYLRCYSECHVFHTMLGRQRFLPSKPLEETEYFTSKMKYLYRALNIHRNLVSRKFERQIEEAMIEDALRCFKRFRETTFDGYTEIRFSPFDSLHDLYRKFLDSNIDCNQSWPSYNSKSGSSMLEICLDLASQRFNDDIVHPFNFISCAYEANFHLTAFENECDEVRRYHWMKAVESCDEAFIVEASTLEKITRFVYPNTLQLMVTVTEEFSGIFDKYINSAVIISGPIHDKFETSEFSVHFSSLDFLRYVRIQCMRKLDVDFKEEEEILKMEIAPFPTPARMLLCHALRLSSELDLHG